MIILVSDLMFLWPKNTMKLSMRLPWVWNFKEIQYGVQYGHQLRVFAITFTSFALE